MTVSTLTPTLRHRTILAGGLAVGVSLVPATPAPIAAAQISEEPPAEDATLLEEARGWIETVEAGFLENTQADLVETLSSKATKSAMAANQDRVRRAAAMAERGLTVVETTVGGVKRIGVERSGLYRFEAHIARTLSNGVSWEEMSQFVARVSDGKLTDVTELAPDDFDHTNDVAGRGIDSVPDMAAPRSFTESPAEPTNHDERVAAAVPAKGVMPNPRAAAQYAVDWWNRRNSAYDNFSNDCTNFVSQALKAGGWGYEWGWSRTRWQDISNDQSWFSTRNSPWWPDANSHSWINAHENAKYIPYRTRKTVLPNVWHMNQGDVLHADWDRDGDKDHTMIVNKKVDGEPYLTYHSTDTVSRPLSDLLAAKPNTWWYAWDA